MPKPFPKDFRDDVVAVARKGQAPLKQIAKDFGIYRTTLNTWMRQAAVENDNKPGVTAGQSEELRELKRRNRLLEHEVRSCAGLLRICRRPTCRDNIYPLVRELAQDGVPSR